MRTTNIEIAEISELNPPPDIKNGGEVSGIREKADIDCFGAPLVYCGEGCLFRGLLCRHLKEEGAK
jgi:hypothetical protein